MRVAWLLILAFCAPLVAAQKPDIVIVLADDLGYGDLSCYGGTVPTPALDRLAREGTSFTQYYSASPICSPSRAGLLTGSHPARWRLTSFLQARAGNRGCEQADFLDTNAPTLPRALKAAGYATAHFGKWHLGGGRDVTNAPKFAAYGYDEHAGTYESPEPHPDITGTNWIWSKHDKVKRWTRTACFVDRTLDFMRRHTNEPVFINLWLDDPHTPWVPEENAPTGDRQGNLRKVLIEMDRQIGRLAKGLRTNTLLIFTSDNGPLPTFQGSRSSGFRGSKLSLYEGGIRVPFIVRWPSRTSAGRVDNSTVISTLDLFPTLCKLSDARPPNGDGEDLSQSFLGTSVKRQRPLFWEYGRNEQFFKYPTGADRSPNLAMRSGDWKLLVQADGSGIELYDLSKDSRESANVADAHPELAEKFKNTLLMWRRELP